MSSAPSRRPTDRHPNHPLFARLYARLGGVLDEGGYAERRDDLLAGLEGRVVEVGCGNGMNFRHYPSAVTSVVAIEPEPYLRERALEQAAVVDVPIEVIDGVAEALPAEDAAFDAGVASLVLCSVSSTDAALAELHRVIRPGGQLRFFEHVRAQTPGLARTQRVLDATVWPHLTGGCHTHRDSVSAIEGAGFELLEVRRFREPDSALVPVSPHALGRARRP